MLQLHSHILLDTAPFLGVDRLHLVVQLIEDQDGADEDFWKQDFFAEERADDEYATESESEDEADTDFSGSVRLDGLSTLFEP